MKKADMIASGYEWICPVCEKLNMEIEYKQTVYCNYCHTGEPYETNEPEHAIGK